MHTYTHTHTHIHTHTHTHTQSGCSTSFISFPHHSQSVIHPFHTVTCHPQTASCQQSFYHLHMYNKQTWKLSKKNTRQPHTIHSLCRVASLTVQTLSKYLTERLGLFFFYHKAFLCVCVCGGGVGGWVWVCVCACVRVCMCLCVCLYLCFTFFSHDCLIFFFSCLVGDLGTTKNKGSQADNWVHGGEQQRRE